MSSQGKGEMFAEIWSVLRDINEAWLEGQPEKLENYFHEDMVIAAPGLKGGGRGREACVQSYRDFIAHADILEYRESDPTVDIWDNTAVASYQFQMTYTMNGQEHGDAGHDLFVFTRQGGKWLAVWRTMILEDKKT